MGSVRSDICKEIHEIIDKKWRKNKIILILRILT